MDRGRKRTGFTLAELLVTLIVIGILLSALATLAFALSSATSTEDETLTKQTQLRQGTLRLLDLVQNCRLICTDEGNALAIWRNDDNEDGLINVDELVYLDKGSSSDTLCLYTFDSSTNPNVTFSSGALSATQSELYNNHNGSVLSLIPDTQDVSFAYDAVPPATQRLTVSFNLVENNQVRPYEINMSLRARASHLLDAAGETLVSDDDE